MELLKHVENYDPEIPRAKFGFPGFRWALLFIFDYTFSLSRQKDKDGNLVKRYKSEGFPGNAYRSIQNKLENKLEQHSKRTFETTLPLPSINAENVSPEFFGYWSKEINMPLVIKGYIKDEEVLELTSIESLVKNHGEKEVKFVNRNFGKKENNRVGHNVELSVATLEDYLTKEELRDSYINNFYGILDDEDYQLRSRGNDIDVLRNQKSAISQWFISRKKNSGSTLHCALADNMFLNIQGRKEWLFIHPSYLPIFKPSLSKYGTYTVAELDEELNIKMDSHKELIKDYPYLRYVPFFRYILEPGDVLYNPSAWWHNVRNHSDYTVGCAVRYPGVQLNNNSFTLSITGLLIAAIKNPKKSFLGQYVKTISGDVKSKTAAIDTIFSKKSDKSKTY